MISNSRIVCPVSVGQRDKNVTRVIATFVLLLTIYALYAHNYIVFLFLMYDFTTRTFFDAKGSVLRFIAKYIVAWLKLTPKPINAAPRKFAAGLGLLFSLILVIL